MLQRLNVFASMLVVTIDRVRAVARPPGWVGEGDVVHGVDAVFRVLPHQFDPNSLARVALREEAVGVAVDFRQPNAQAGRVAAARGVAGGRPPRRNARAASRATASRSAPSGLDWPCRLDPPRARAPVRASSQGLPAAP